MELQENEAQKDLFRKNMLSISLSVHSSSDKLAEHTQNDVLVLF